MKTSLTLIALFFVTFLNAQIDDIAKCGVDDNPILNDFEAAYFNHFLTDKRGEFDFTGKKIAFYRGNLSCKTQYFQFGQTKDLDYHIWNTENLATSLLILTEEEKAISGGYDAMLLSWAKFVPTPKTRMKRVKKLGEGLLP
ncbi:MAG: hypothetical protein ACSHXL_01945 [Bacteroidota bacterium]